MLLLNWFKKPFFFTNSFKFNLILSLGVGLFIFLFLFTFKPFGISRTSHNLFFYTAGFGSVTFICTFFFFIILPKFFSNFFDNENWTIGKNIVFYFLLVLSISFLNYFYNSIINSTENLEILYLKDFLIYTFSIAVFPIVFCTYLLEFNSNLQRSKTSKEIMDAKASKRKLIKENKLNNRVQIFGENNKDNITFNINDLVYITSEGNYSSFYIKNKNGIEENILRITLTRIFNDLNAYTDIIRCHKSYIINKNFINSIIGNARGYYLKSNYIQGLIPVSRNFKKEELNTLIS